MGLCEVRQYSSLLCGESLYRPPVGRYEWCRKVAVSSPLELIGNCDRFSWSCLIFLYDKEDVIGVPENFVKH